MNCNIRQCRFVGVVNFIHTFIQLSQCAKEYVYQVSSIYLKYCLSYRLHGKMDEHTDIGNISSFPADQAHSCVQFFIHVDSFKGLQTTVIDKIVHFFENSFTYKVTQSHYFKKQKSSYKAL